MSNQQFLKVNGKRPDDFRGSVRLPPSKSYLHRAIFVASLAHGTSRITGCGTALSEDIEATIRALASLGVAIERKQDRNGTLLIHGTGRVVSSRDPIFVGGSGTTARFLISYTALAEDSGTTKIIGDKSLSKRPMQPLIDSLRSLGVICQSEKKDGKLPVLVQGRGIKGNHECIVDGTISSQFVSSLLISCTRAKGEISLRIADPRKLVSEPYIKSTLSVLDHFGFVVKKVRSEKQNYLAFRMAGSQRGKPNEFAVPPDMSSGAALVCAALSAQGSVHLLGVNLKSHLPQADSAIFSIVRKFGAKVSSRDGYGPTVRCGKALAKTLRLDLKESPDLVPVVAGLAAGTNLSVRIVNVGHLRFKESDRLSTLAEDLRELGVRTKETRSTLTVDGRAILRRKPILLDPENDHRILMALTVAGLSGRFGAFSISNPNCVKKSYPEFISDIQKLAHDKDIVKIVARS